MTDLTHDPDLTEEERAALADASPTDDLPAEVIKTPDPAPADAKPDDAKPAAEPEPAPEPEPTDDDDEDGAGDDEEDDDGDGEGDSDGDGDQDGSGKRPKLTEEEKKAIRDEIKEAMVAAAQAAGAGKVPAGVARMITDFTEPKMDWRQMLRMNIQSIFKSNFSFTRPNRKSQHCGAILPGMMNDETIDVSVAIDMSGSISDEMAKDFISEVKGIMDEYKDFKLDLWCFDTSVYNYAKFTGDTADEIMDYKVKGGGGTDFDVNYEFMKENGIEPKRFIMFTDGYPCGSWGDEDYCESLFIVHGNDSIVSPFGQTAYYSKD
jgi:predicted metal-dependent peptidase